MSGDSALLREHVMACARAGVRAADPALLVREALAGGIKDELAGAGSLRVLAVGKAACAMAAAATELLPNVTEAVVITNHCDSNLGRAEVIIAGHPVPNEGSVRAGQRALALMQSAGNNDAVLALISGGGSALMALPAEGVSLDDVRVTTDLLLRAGASISELNCVRKHIDRVKGGRLARAAQPARTVVLMLSDVVGDALDAIASGPFSPDTTTHQDALDVLAKFDLETAVPHGVVAHLQRGVLGEVPESPRADDVCFESVEARVIGSVATAVAGARAEAERLGYDVTVTGTTVIGEARVVGTEIARRALHIQKQLHAQAVCLLSGGETTVTVRGHGTGGRNQELALAAAIALDGSSGIMFASIGTDGTDGPTDAAGAIADGTTIARARARGLDAHAALTQNNAYPYFDAVGDLVRTGPTGTNVNDLQIVVIA